MNEKNLFFINKSLILNFFFFLTFCFCNLFKLYTKITQKTNFYFKKISHLENKADLII
jgi:hypothetical protein